MPDFPSGAAEPASQPTLRRMTGHLLLVHGARFVLVGENSVTKQFQLQRGMAFDPEALAPLLHERRRVTVEYRRTGELWADTAVRILVEA